MRRSRDWMMRSVEQFSNLGFRGLRACRSASTRMWRRKPSWTALQQAIIRMCCSMMSTKVTLTKATKMRTSPELAQQICKGMRPQPVVSLVVPSAKRQSNCVFIINV